MELRHLVYFVTVAEERNFTRASERLRVVQSGVSAAIRALERELGVQLFERTSQRVVLTDAGTALLPAARATIDAAQAARDAVDEVRGGLRGTLRIGTLISVGFVDLPGLLGDFHAQHPGVDLRLRAAPSGSAGLARSLLDGELDVAFLSLAGRPPAGLSLRTLVADPIVAVLPDGHRLAGQESVTLAEIADEPFVDSPLGYGNRTEVDRGFAAAGLQRRVALEVADIATVAPYVRNGLGIALLPRFAVPTVPGDGRETPGDVGKTSGDARETPGDARKTSGDARKTLGDAGETSGDAGKTSGDAGETPGGAGETPGGAGETPGVTVEPVGTVPADTGRRTWDTGGGHGAGSRFVVESGLRVLPVTGARLRWTFGVATASARRPSAAVRALLGLVDIHRAARPLTDGKDRATPPSRR